MQRFVEWIVEYRRLVVATAGALTLVLALQVRHLEIIVDTAQLLPQEHPYIVATNIAERLFGGRYVVVVAVTPRSGDIFAQPVLARVRNMTEALMRIPGVARRRTLSIASAKVKDIRGDTEGISAHALMGKIPATAAELQILGQAIDRNPLLDDVLVSRDRRTAAITVDFPTAPDGFRALESGVERAIAEFRDDTIEVQITGLPIYLSALERFSGRMVFLLPIAILIAALMHYEAFRTVQGLMLPLVTALGAVVWGLGIMILFGLHQLDPFSNAAPILIIAVAAGHAVQILKRYYEAYHDITITMPAGREANCAAVVNAVTAIGPVMVAAGGVAAASFLSLLVFDIQSIRTFGTFAACGILSALVIELTFIPAIRAMLPPPGAKASAHERARTSWDRIVAALAELVLGQGRTLVFVTGLVVATFGGAGMLLLVQDNSLRSFFSEDQPFRIADKTVNERLAGTNRLSILIEGDREDSIKEPEVLKAMLATQRFLEASPMVGATVSIADFVARMNRAMHDDDPAAETIPESADLVAQYLLLYSMSGDPDDFDSYVDTGYRHAVIQAFVKTDSSAYVAELANRLAPFLATTFGPGFTARMAGNLTAPAAMSDMVVRGKFLNMAMVAGVVAVMASMLFHSVVAGLLVLIPLATVALVNFGVMGFLGIPLQVATATVAALGIGVGADYAIYFTYRLRDELRDDADLGSAVRRTYATAGKASLYVASAVGGGYGILAVSRGFKIHLWLGGMLALAMAVSVLSALTLYPAMLLSLRPRFIFRRDRQRAGAVCAPAGALALIAVCLATAVPCPADGAESMDALNLMQQNYESTRFRDTSTEATLTLAGTGGDTREWRATGLSMLEANGRDEKRLTRFVSPANIKGSVVLSVQNAAREDDIWAYLPALHKVRRIAAGEKRDAFVGTEFSHGCPISVQKNVLNWRKSEFGYVPNSLRSATGTPSSVGEVGRSPRLATPPKITSDSSDTDHVRNAWMRPE